MQVDDVVFFTEDHKKNSWRSLDVHGVLARIHEPWSVLKPYTSKAGEFYAFVKPMNDERPFPWCDYYLTSIGSLRFDPFLTASRKAVRRRWNWLRKIRDFWYPLWH